MSNNTTPELIRMPEIQGFVDAIEQFHQKCNEESRAIFPQPVQQDQTSFDPMRYFALLPKLQPPQGRVLDWAHVGHSNAYPFLYWRDSHAAPHTTREQIKTEPGWSYGSDMQEAITSAVQTEDSPQGWVHLVLFRLLAGLTMLYWHSKDKAVTLLCSQQDLQAKVDWQSAGWHDFQRLRREFPNAPVHNVYKPLVESKDPVTGEIIETLEILKPVGERSLHSRQHSDLSGRHMTPETAAAALALDVVPTVDLCDANTVRVCITRFSVNSGFHRQTWVMNRQGPHGLKLEKEVLEVRYWNGVVL